jgi:HlyD family secretion protein
MRSNALIALCFSLLLFGCNSDSRTDKGPLQLQGYVEGELSYMALPFAGTLEALVKQRGTSVKKDETLFILDPDPEDMRAISAKSQIIEAQSRLDLAKARLSRTQELFKDKAIDRDSLDAAIDNYNEAKGNLIEAEQKSLEANWNLGEKMSKAPVDGRVYETYFTKGEWVKSGEPVLSILAPENIRILFFIPANRLHEVKMLQKIHVIVGNKRYEAQINYISPQVEYTPPVIYSRDNDVPLVFRVKANPLLSQAYNFHPGEPVMVEWMPAA